MKKTIFAGVILTAITSSTLAFSDVLSNNSTSTAPAARPTSVLTPSAATAQPVTVASAAPTTAAAPTAAKPIMMASSQNIGSAPTPTVLNGSANTNAAKPVVVASSTNQGSPAKPVVLADASTVSPEQQKQIEQVVHSYLIKNPEVIVESIQVLQQRQQDQAKQTIQKTEQTAPKFADVLFHQAIDPSAGNANGKVIVVDFFDYQCPHCIRMTPIIDSLIKTNPNVHVVFKEFPIRGPISEFASKAALAAKNQGKYFEFHKALMQAATSAPLTEDSILKIAQSLGLNVAQLKTDMKSDAIS